MRKLNLLAAALAAATPAALAAPVQAQEYGYGPPPPAYAAAGVNYAPYGYDEEGGHRHRGFELVGARAGITVLGVNLDGSAGVRLSVGDHDGYRRRVVEAPPPPPVPYSGEGYAEGPPAYAPPSYPPSYAPAYPSYAYGYPCGCQAYGW